MVIVKFGDGDAQSADVSSRAELAECIVWLLAILDDMELKGRDSDHVIDFGYYGRDKTP
jgi:hypothetical protein